MPLNVYECIHLVRHKYFLSLVYVHILAETDQDLQNRH